ncbi:Crp/Fnr family transcriptional regulator [Aurantiacibacter sp. MUD11]|uniref:Crp/Fnr family transcriptional regulator n=1 Tax=Aurantiacibacter sp. MUD11 TaxID=3003265 RepID=UPI0022AA3099|nr:Crp/Fnr family transcriptional regulator [Aurantiacibacter sp. MUD11]WAT19174.1 Crp/Fnr family transcriptional regulator [Aurantiacibacter sp. MUD11]
MTERDNLIEQVAPDSLLRALEPAQLEELLRSSNRRDLKRGEVIISQGDDVGDFAVVLLSGSLKISMVSVNGREIILNYCSPGDVVGEITLLDSGPRTASVSAAEPSSVLVIPAPAFEQVALTNPASMIGLLRAMASRLRQLNRVVESDRAFSMAPRLARAMVRLLDPEDRENGKLRHNPSQGDLGAFAGLARENVNRLLAEWEDQGIVERNGRGLEVREREYLEFLAEFGDD